MKLLMHICCAPCTIYPLQILKPYGHEVCGLFYNPNIHPYREYEKRRDALKSYADRCALRVMCPEEYAMEDFLRNVAFREEDRCRFCYFSRLQYTAQKAREAGFDAFTTTLLYSKFQNHELIKSIAESIASEHNIEFYYHDFRGGWTEGQRLSREMGIYRQSYCGCIYSEKERFYAATQGSS